MKISQNFTMKTWDFENLGDLVSLESKTPFTTFGRLWLQKVDHDEKKPIVKNPNKVPTIKSSREGSYSFEIISLVFFTFSVVWGHIPVLKKNRLVAFTRHFASHLSPFFFLFLLVCHHVRFLGWFTGQCFDPCSPSVESILD